MKMSRRKVLQLCVASGASVSLRPGMTASASPEHLASEDIEKAFVCFRIGVPLWLTEPRFTELLDLFDRHRGVTDEITLFTSETHPPLPLGVIWERAPILRTRMEAARARGYKSGINPLATIGHHEENLANSLTGDYTLMTDINGTVCRGSFCPNDERRHAYTVQMYEALVAAKPDYIWLDDDIRLYGHMPIGACCFCDTCIQRFSERVGQTFTRETLRNALSSGPVDEKLRLRRAFLQHNRDTLSRLFRLIETTVHGLAPGLPLGFMTGDRFYEGYDFDTWAEVLAGADRAPVFWRPGGGTYRDERLDDIVDKAHAMGRQTALLPASVQCIESELESFPYQRLKKSAHATALEASAYIAAGCTGTAFNVLSMYDESLDEYEPLVAHLRTARPFLNRLARTCGRAPSVGVHSGWVKDAYAAHNPESGWFGGPGAPRHCNEIWATGLPAAYTAKHGCVTALSDDQVLALTEDEIRQALRGGLYLDGPALTRLNERGFGALTGFNVVDVRHEDCIEEMTDHPLNGLYAGRRRNGRQSFWKCPTFLLEPTAKGAHTLSRCVDYTYEETAPCCLGIYENDDGGRVCVAGYYPWEQLQNLSKSAQLKSVLRWLSKDTLPAYVDSFHRVNLWVRQKNAETMAVAVLNAYLDAAERIELLVRTESDRVRVADMRDAEAVVETRQADGPYRRVTLPSVPPWEMVLVTV